MIIAFITRGICPAECFYDVVCKVQRKHDFDLHLISGKPLIEAKNEAVDRALELGRPLLLVEDDIVADDQIWEYVARWTEKLKFGYSDQPDILFAETVEKHGRINVRYNKHGDLMWTGNVFTAISHDILMRLEKPVFRSWNFVLSGDGNTMLDRGPASHGDHSDAYFWWTVQKLDPKPEIINIGRVDHIITPFNSGNITNHKNPFTMKPFPDTTGRRQAV